MSDKQMSWSFFGCWNNAIAREQRPMQPREHMWASEIGGAYIDRFLRMKGEQPTNPPNMRSLRKFQAGHEWERNVRMLLAFAGIHQKSEAHLKHQYPSLLEVTGRADFIAGGKPDWDLARKRVADYALLGDEVDLGDDDFYMRIIANLEKVLGNNELKTIILELKSCSSFMFDAYEATGKANPHHVLQLFHYLKSTGLPEGHIVYICKDDCRMLEIPVFNPSPVEEAYRLDIEKMTKYFRDNIMPEKEQEIIFNPDLGKFQKNWKIEYSGYLKKIYGYDEPDNYRAVVDPQVSGFNRVLARQVMIANGKTTPTGKPIVLTKGNLEAMEKCKAVFPNYDSFVKIAVDLSKKGILPIEEESET